MSQFGAEKFTTRSREAIETAQLAATTAGNTQTEPIHLLAALLRDAGRYGAPARRQGRRRRRVRSPPRPRRRAGAAEGAAGRPSSSPRRRRR